ncbi:MAG TPA: DNA methyltransferase, partial [Acidimicrobiia bacterium]
MWARDGGFPYVNGGLFADQMAFPPLTDRALRALQDASAADWSDLDPFLFGSLYQQTHTLDDRAEHGQHFTSAVNIRKALDPLFLNTFRTRLDAARGRREQLLELQRDLARLRVLDPAAGCGNFLLVAYQDVKTIEREVITELLATGMQAHSTLINVPEGEYAGRTTIALRPPKPTPRAKQPPDVYVPLVQMTHFAGIELDEPAAALARTVLILAAVQAEFALGETTDLTRTPLPLSDDTNATVHATNALQFNWANAWIDYDGVFNEHTVIVGNPPFLGPRQRNDSQRADHQHVWGDVPSAGSTDYVTNWFLLAGRYMQHTHARAAFVSTNSLTQGEQPAIVWTQLHQLGMHIDFAYRTFPWANGAGQQAAVHCVIIGFSANPRPSTVRLWDEHNNCRDVPHINAYLTDGDEVLVWGRSEPLSARTPPMRSGSIPRDGGHLSKINETEAQRIREHDTTASKYLRRLYGADELIKGNIRYCLWLVDVAPADVRNSTELKTRIADVKSYRETKPYLRKQATTPHLFADRYQPHNPFLAVPSVSSQTRDYLPCAYLTENDIVNNAVFTITNCPTWLFGV